jgi:hypothetical protein
VKNKEIIEALGGVDYIAEYLGVSKSAVYLWFHPKPKGSGGKIPPARAIKIFELAQKRKIKCTINDILG